MTTAALLAGMMLLMSPQTQSSTPAEARAPESPPPPPIASPATAPTQTEAGAKATEARRRSPFQSHVDLEVPVGVMFGGMLSFRTDLQIVNPMVHAFVRVGDSLAFSGTIGGVALAGGPAGVITTPTNPFFAAHYLMEPTEVHSIRLGLGLATPVEVPTQGGSQGLFLFSGASKGFWNPWLYLPGMSVVLPARYEGRGEHFGGAVDFGMALVVPARAPHVEFAVQFAPEAFAILGPVDLGLCFQLASIPTADNTDLTQTALKPFARLAVDAFRAGLAFYFMLDEPLGPSFGQTSLGTSVFTVETSIGVAF